MSGNRPINPLLQAAIETRAVSLCAIMQIGSRLAGYPVIGVSGTNARITYDDGDGDVIYSPYSGFVPSNAQATATMSVGNTQSKSIIPPSMTIADAPISVEDVRAGAYDDARYRIYIIDFLHPEYGHWIPPGGYGVVGRVTLDERELSVVFELTDPTKWLKQSVVDNWSRNCRAIFGSQPWGTGGGVIEQEESCGFDLSTLWSATQTVTGVGAESTRTFTASGLGAAADTYIPGVLEWLSGDNTGRTEMVESQSGTGVISLKFPMFYPVQSGDTFKIRHDCTNRRDGAHGCKDNWSVISVTEWKGHYRGEPDTPVADGDSLTTPGAQM